MVMENEALTPEVYDSEMAKMGRPIPGQSLTNEPNHPEPYERAPQFTNVHEASEYMWDILTEETTYPKLMVALDKEVPVMRIVEALLFNEFQKGSFNPDLMLMMAEPLAYMLIALGERLDIDMVITEDDDEDEGEQLFGVGVEEQQLERLRNSLNGNVPSGFITPEMQEELNALPEVPSLLSNKQTTEVEEEPAAEMATQQPSLMAPPEGQ